MAKRKYQYDNIADLKKVLEPLMTIGSASGAEVLSGLGGIASGGDTGFIDYIQKGLTYQPRTPEGKEGMQALGQWVQSLAEMTNTQHLPGYWNDRVVPALQNVTTPKVGSALGAAGLGAMSVLGAGKNPMTKVKHSSPFDFERFSLEHMGKGEGAKTYGPGIYFAEDGSIAGLNSSYDSDFSRHPNVKHLTPVRDKNGTRVGALNRFFGKEVELLGNKFGDKSGPYIAEILDRKIKGAKESIAEMTEEIGQFDPSDLLKQIEMAETAKQMALDGNLTTPTPRNRSHSYDVDLDDNPESQVLLDLDFDDQPQNYKDMVRGLQNDQRDFFNKRSKENGGKTWEDMTSLERLRLKNELVNDGEIDRDFGRLLNGDIYGERSPLDNTRNMMRLEIPRILANQGEKVNYSDKNVMDFYKSKGLRSSKFLDYNSRANDNIKFRRKYNHVVWDEDMINITKKYGPAGAAAGLMGAAAQEEEDGL